MRDIAITLLLIGLVPVILRRPWIGILAWYVISLVNPHKLAWGFAQELPVANVVGICTLVGLFATKERRGVAWTPEMVLLALFALFVTLTTVFAWNTMLALEQWYKVIKIYLLVFVSTMLIFGRDRVRALYYTVVFSMVFYGAKGGLFSLLGGGESHVQGHAGFMGGNTDLGLGMAMALPLIYAAAREQTVAWRRWAGWGAFWLTVIATIFTYSRGAWLGLAAVMGLLFLFSKRKLVVVAIIVPAMIAAIPFIPEKVHNRADTIQTYEQDHSAMMRVQAWTVAINVAMRHPLGAGFAIDYTPSPRWLSYANFLGEWYNQTRAAHSIYFQVLGEHGFIGLFLFLGIIAASFVTLSRVKRAARKAPELSCYSDYAGALQIGLVAYCVSGAFLNLAYFDLFYLFVILGAVMLRDLGEYAANPAAFAAKAQPAPAVAPVSPSAGAVVRPLPPGVGASRVGSAPR